MATTHTSTSAAIRKRLDHPIIDADGHTVEFQPAFLDCLRQVGGTEIVGRYKAVLDEGGFNGALNGWFRWHSLSKEERVDGRVPRPPWWGLTTNTRDRVTVTLPNLLYERLDEFGMDFTILYPTGNLLLPHLEDAELRQVACRAFNTFYADILRDYTDRLAPVALIPMHTPQEAVEELEYAVKVLGIKVAMIAGHVIRPVSALARKYPEAGQKAFWLDTFGLDSAYDYDPVWAKCVELKVVPTQHSSGQGWGSRQSISSFVYNHIGSMAAAGEALCKSLFLGGVTRRFPSLKFAFLECGVGWACNLYALLYDHWKKRSLKGLERTNPANLNRELLLDLYRRYGGKLVEGRLGQAAEGLSVLMESREDPAMRDEFAACQIQREEDVRDLFVPHFYFGCEADDPMNVWAFNTKVNPLGGRLRPIFSSDIGHFDVPEMTEVVAEAYELVEKGLITEEDFRDFMFTNPVSLYAGMNPDFFKGTVVENEVEKLLAAQ